MDTKLLRATDPHFLNIACSRAKHMLIVVGNFVALRKCADWNTVHEHAQKCGVLLDLKKDDFFISASFVLTVHGQIIICIYLKYI